MKILSSVSHFVVLYCGWLDLFGESFFKHAFYVSLLVEESLLRDKCALGFYSGSKGLI